MSKEKLYPIQVYSDKHQSKKERAKGLVKIRYEAYEKLIPKSYLEADNLVVKDGNVKIPKEIFKVWFEKAAEDERQREIRSEIKKEATPKVDRILYCIDLNHPFYIHLPLFWKNREMILSKPHFFNIGIPQSSSSSRYLPLGTLLRNWDRVGRRLCGECGQKESVSCVVGHGDTEEICLSCGCRSFGTSYGGHKFYYYYYGGLRKYTVEPSWVSESDLSELIRACKRY